MAAEAVTPFWAQPSHPAIQEVRHAAPGNFMTRSYSRIHVPPFGLFAKLEFPPCTKASAPTYATVQMGKESHLNLNSDLLYINHGCDPSLIFDIPTLSILAGPKGLSPGEELTFFYPSTEWAMAQSFSCTCASSRCKGRISGARDMAPQQLEGVWLNGFIREMLTERDAATGNGVSAASRMSGANGINGTNGLKGLQGVNGIHENGTTGTSPDTNSLIQAKRNGTHHVNGHGGQTNGHGNSNSNGNGAAFFSSSSTDEPSVRAGRSGPTSRELSGEMGGDTNVV